MLIGHGMCEFREFSFCWFCFFVHGIVEVAQVHVILFAAGSFLSGIRGLCC